MDTEKQDFLAARLCLGILILFCGITFLRIGTRAAILLSGKSSKFGDLVFFDSESFRAPTTSSTIKNGEQAKINWQELYPFTEESEIYFAEATKGLAENGADSDKKYLKLQLQTLTSKIDFIDTFCTEGFFCRDSLITAAHKIEKCAKWPSEVETEVIKLKNGHFTEYCEKIDTTQMFQSLLAFVKVLKSKDIPFLYVQAPYKIDPNDGTLSGVKDFSNQNADELLQKLAEYKINYIDMRQEIQKTGKDLYDFFYITDHHWKAEAGLWACKIIAEKLNELADTKIDTSILNEENFNFTVYLKSFLGSRGRTVTLANAQMEDITLITPKEHFELAAEIYDDRKLLQRANGIFTQTLIFTEHLQNEENTYKDDAYCIYLSGSTIAFIKNSSTKNGKKVLILGDSFTNVVEPFLALGVKELDCVDLRHCNISLNSLIKAKHYDACILLINPNAFTNDIDWQSHTDLWDFR